MRVHIYIVHDDGVERGIEEYNYNYREKERVS